MALSVNVCVCVCAIMCASLHVSVFRLSEEGKLFYRLCFLSTFVYRDKTEIMCGLRGVRPSQRVPCASGWKHVNCCRGPEDPPGSSCLKFFEYISLSRSYFQIYYQVFHLFIACSVIVKRVLMRFLMCFYQRTEPSQ